MKFILNNKGVVEILNSPQIESVLMKHANKVKNKVGDGYKSKIVKSSDRKKAIIATRNKKTVKDNLKNNTLLKGIR